MGEAVLRFIDATIGDEPFAVVGMSYGGRLARHVVAERGAQVLGTALIAPLVKPSGQRTLPEREVLTRDEALLDSLDPEDRKKFAEIAVYQDEAGWSAFRDHVLPGIRAHHREDAAALLKAYMLTETPEARFGTHDGPHLLVTGRQDHARAASGGPIPGTASVRGLASRRSLTASPAAGGGIRSRAQGFRPRRPSRRDQSPASGKPLAPLLRREPMTGHPSAAGAGPSPRSPVTRRRCPERQARRDGDEILGSPTTSTVFGVVT